jgi:hypothetical protein
VLCTESFDTMYNEVAQTWTPWCGASCLHPMGRSHRQRLAGELTENPNTTKPSRDAGVAGVQFHNAHHSQLASSSGRSEWPLVAPG